MGFWGRVVKGETPIPVIADAAPAFSLDAGLIDEKDIPPAFYGLSSYITSTAPAPRIDRRSAMQVPAVKRGVDLIAGLLGTLPVDLIGPDGTPSKSTLFDQPEPDVPRSVTMVKTFADLVCEGIAWWFVLDIGWHGYPTKVRRLDPRSVNVMKTGRVYVSDAGHYGMVNEWPTDAQLIRFDSGSEGLLTAGARAIRTAIALDSAAQRFADGTPPLDYFTPAEGVDPADDEDVTAVLDAWQAARQARATGYVPAALQYHSNGFNPEQLQMADARQHAVLEIARALGVDPEDLGVSTTSRTYQNAQDRRLARIQDTLRSYLSAFEDRLTMGDVTPRGYTARFDLSDLLRADDATRMTVATQGLTNEVLLPAEARNYFDPRLPQDIEVSTAETVEDNVTNSAALKALEDLDAPDFAPLALPTVRFDAGPEIRLDAPGAIAFEVDEAKRTISGLLVPYGVTAYSGGQQWQFSQGSLTWSDPSRVKLWVQHDATRAVGKATNLDDRADGLYGSFQVARGAEGDQALSMAADGVWDGFSVGLGMGGKFAKRDGVNHAITAPLMETSLTPAPSFDDARVHSVAASAATTRKEPAMGDEQDKTEAPDFSGISDAIKTGFAEGFAQFMARPQDDAAKGPKVSEREVIPAAGGSVQVSEELPYRFDGSGNAAHSFSADLRALASGDAEAKGRLDAFMDEVAPVFAVTSANVSTLNPTINRPELYVANLQYARPLASLVSTGTLDNKTPFTVPKFSAASGLVGDHTEGTEPTPGSFSATNQTITPGALSGKVEIDREVWDQGGSPQADQIIWTEMTNGYFEAAESKIAALLNGSAQAEFNLAGAVDGALQQALLAKFAGLQFVRGGDRFTSFAADGMLYPALVGAKDTNGRALFPIFNPTNAQGQTSAGLESVKVGAKSAVPAWALGATNASKSYLFVPTSVWQWLSAPKQFTFEYQVKSIDMGIWGYHAEAIIRDSDVIPVDYTTADS